MRSSSVLLHKVSLRDRAAQAVRPSIEALLLAAVALGCAQAGWTLLTPATAGAASASASNDDHTLDIAEVGSPFAPDAGSAGSHAITALLSSIELKGVRLLTDAPERNGAMFAFADGGDRAFMLGEEVVDGVTLEAVDASHVLLSYEGGQRQLEMRTDPSFSFARAMMGLDLAPGASPDLAQTTAVDGETNYALALMGVTPVVEVQSAAAALPAVAEQPAAVDADLAWLAATLAQVEMADGQMRGWRVADPLPEAVLAAGLRGGDLVVAVNGAGADNVPGAIASAQTGHLSLDVERGDARLTVAVALNERS